MDGSATNALPTTLGIALGFGLVVILLAATKTWYTHHRRIRLIHTPPPTRALPLYQDMSMSLHSSRSMLASRHMQSASLADLGILDTPSLSSATISSSSATMPPSSISKPAFARDLSSSGISVGFLGSPDWEIELTRGIDKTARFEAIEYAEDDIMRAVHALPSRSLSRMSSRATIIAHETSLHTLSKPMGLSSLLGCATDSSPSLMSPQTPSYHYLPRYISSPTTPMASPASLISISLLSPKAATLLDVFPVPSPTVPRKAASLLDLSAVSIDSPSTSRLVKQSFVPRVITTVASPTPSLTSSPRDNIRPFYLPPKVVDRLGVAVPLGPPSPTWSEYSTSSLKFYGSTPAAIAGLGLKMSPRVGHALHTRASSTVLPADEIGRLKRARKHGHQSHSSISSTATSSKSSTHSIRRKPVPAWEGVSPSPSAASILSPLASSFGQVESAPTGTRVTFADFPLPPRTARRTRSVGALSAYGRQPATPAIDHSRASVSIDDSTSPHSVVRRSPSMPALTTGLGLSMLSSNGSLFVRSAPMINVIEPTPVKSSSSAADVSVSDARGKLVVPDWSGSTLDMTAVSTVAVEDEAPPSPTDSGIHVELHPMVRTERSAFPSRPPSPESSSASSGIDSAPPSRPSTPTPTPGGSVASLPIRRRPRPLDVRSALGPTTRPLNLATRTSPTGSTFTFGEPPAHEPLSESSCLDHASEPPRTLRKMWSSSQISVLSDLSKSASASSRSSMISTGDRKPISGSDEENMDFVCCGERRSTRALCNRGHIELIVGGAMYEPASSYWF